jgi:hypothetical protein
MKMMLAGMPALLLAAVYLPTMDTRRANPEPGVNTSLTQTAGGARIAQGEVQIASDAQLERMQERAIITPPLDARCSRKRSQRRGGDPADGRARSPDRRATDGGWRDLH